MLRLRAVFFTLLLALGCHEIPPEIPPDHAGSTPSVFGWPAPPAYHPERVHPANRWFQRAFSRRFSEGDLEPAWSEDPLPLLDATKAVDRAEIAALTRAVLAEGKDSVVGGAFGVRGSRAGEPPVGGSRADESRADGAAVSSAVFASDALQLALRARNPGPAARSNGLTSILLEAAELPSGPDSAAWTGPVRGRLVPPPLREGTWIEVPDRGERGHGPSDEDSRWTRVFRESSAEDSSVPPRSVLLWQRVALESERRPLALTLPSECWELSKPEPAIVPSRDIESELDFDALEEPDSQEDQGEGIHARIRDLPPVRVWRFDRARWTMGQDPWVRLRDGAPVVVVDPEDIGRRQLRGRLRTVCAACHAADSVRLPLTGPPSGSPLDATPPEARLRAQLHALERVVNSIRGDSNSGGDDPASADGRSASSVSDSESDSE